MYRNTTQKSSFHLFNTLAGERLSQFFDVHVCATNHKLEHAANVNLLLSLFLEFVGNLVLRNNLCRLGAKSLTYFLELLHVDLTRVSKESDYEIWSQENDSLVFVLKLLSELRKRTNIKSWVCLVGFDEVGVRSIVL